ncbi:MAG: hypothetical protein HRU10_00355 [Opitutales bacterium]|nr:hypothetical protein [Opitutales bacterium]
MSQESDTPNDSKPMRLKLSGNTPEGNKESAEKNPSTEPKSDSENATEKKAISFKKAEPKSSDSETADTKSAGKDLKKVPLKGLKKAQATPDPLLDPDIEIAFDTPKLPKTTQAQNPVQTDAVTPEGLENGEESSEENISADAPKKLGLKTAADSASEQTKPSSSEAIQDSVTDSEPHETEQEPSSQEATPETAEPKQQSGKSALVILAAVLILLLGLGGYFGWLIVAGTEESAPTTTPSPPSIAKTTTQSEPVPAPAEETAPVVVVTNPLLVAETDLTSETSADPADSTTSSSEQTSNPISARLNQMVTTTQTARELADQHNKQRAVLNEIDLEATPTPLEEENTAAGQSSAVLPTPPIEAVEKPVVTARENKRIARSDPEPSSVLNIPQNPNISAWISTVVISSYSESLQRASIGPIVFKKGERVNEDLMVTLFYIKDRVIYFQDGNGAVYSKPL